MRQMGERALVICDLPGPESVAFGAAMAEDADLVVQIENLPHAREVVPLRETLAALVHLAPSVRAAKLARLRSDPHKEVAGRHGVVVLDRRRLRTTQTPRTEFDNRHWAYLPSSTALQKLDVRRVVYVHPCGDGRELDDLNEELVQYERRGLPVLFLECGADLPDLSDSTRHRVSRQPTPFFALAFCRAGGRMTEGYRPMAVRVRPGVVEATLGDVGGVVGVARRVFEVGGVEYVDVDLSAETIEQFPVERRNSFFDRKMVFTRPRLPRTSVEPDEASSSNAIDLIGGKTTGGA
jgi:hypothetical protein